MNTQTTVHTGTINNERGADMNSTNDTIVVDHNKPIWEYITPEFINSLVDELPKWEFFDTVSGRVKQEMLNPAPVLVMEPEEEESEAAQIHRLESHRAYAFKGSVDEDSNETGVLNSLAEDMPGTSGLQQLSCLHLNTPEGKAAESRRIATGLFNVWETTRSQFSVKQVTIHHAQWVGYKSDGTRVVIPGRIDDYPEALVSVRLEPKVYPDGVWFEIMRLSRNAMHGRTDTPQDGRMIGHNDGHTPGRGGCGPFSPVFGHLNADLSQEIGKNRAFYQLKDTSKALLDMQKRIIKIRAEYSQAYAQKNRYKCESLLKLYNELCGQFMTLRAKKDLAKNEVEYRNGIILDRVERLVSLRMVLGEDRISFLSGAETETNVEDFEDEKYGRPEEQDEATKEEHLLNLAVNNMLGMSNEEIDTAEALGTLVWERPDNPWAGYRPMSKNNNKRSDLVVIRRGDTVTLEWNCDLAELGRKFRAIHDRQKVFEAALLGQYGMCNKFKDEVTGGDAPCVFCDEYVDDKCAKNLTWVR